MILPSLRRASAYRQPLRGVTVIRCHHILQQPGITVGGAFRVRFLLRRTWKSILRFCLPCWSHTPRISESAQQSFPLSSVAPFTTKIPLPACICQPKCFSALQRWAFQSILIYTFLAMAPIHRTCHVAELAYMRSLVFFLSIGITVGAIRADTPRRRRAKKLSRVRVAVSAPYPTLKRTTRESKR